MPRTRSRTSAWLPKSADYSAKLVEEFLREEKRNGFRTAIPKGCNCVVVILDKPVAKALRDRERAHLAAMRAQREAWHQARRTQKQR
jgi:hypothetical protein